MVSKLIEQVDGEVADIKIGYLQGVIMPNGEFVTSGHCFWIDDEADGDKKVACHDIFVEVEED